MSDSPMAQHGLTMLRNGYAVVPIMPGSDVPQSHKDLAVMCHHCETWTYRDEVECFSCGASMAVKEGA